MDCGYGKGGESCNSRGSRLISGWREKHWHGATQDSGFSHIVITRTEVKTTQLED